MTTQTFTDGVTQSQAAWATDVDTETYKHLTAVAGTNTITATGPASLTAHTTGRGFTFVPANTNTGATTLNPTCNSVALGAKNVFWNGVACVGGELRASIPVWVLYDGTQYHIIASGFHAPFLDTHPIVQGSGDSTKKVRIEADGITTATTRVITMPDADVTLLTGAATQAEQETGTITTAAVTPGRQVFHQSAAKGHVQAGVSGDIRGDSFNVSSVTDSATGQAAINWTVSFSGSTYPVIVGGYGANNSNIFANLNSTAGQSTNASNVVGVNGSTAATSDPSVGYNVVAFGDR